MGASKRLCEILFQAAASNVDTYYPIYSMVRFGNVLASSGSVIPRFHAQIAQGGPVTVTHPAITRYFMTIPEAVELVLQATSMAKGGDLFLLDMGEPVRIADLARQMIELSGLRVKETPHSEGDISIIYTGLRPGEKLYEELLLSNNNEKTSHPMIRRAIEPIDLPEDFTCLLDELNDALTSWNEDLAIRILNSIVHEYQPSNN
jgi:FlaA1/EpsC-like NDP-sugar epimerase